MATALITGITGQDGSYLAERLTREGHAVHGLVRPGDGAAEVLARLCPEAVLHEGDLRDPTIFEVLLDRVHPEEIYHLGGISSVAQSWEQPLETARVTALSTAALLDCVHRLAAKQTTRVTLAASAEIFGASTGAPLHEGSSLRPVSPYGAAKAYTHQLAAIYRSRGVHVCSMILFNHESPRRPMSFVTRRITSQVAAIAQGRASQIVLGNLEARRDWGWAPDYVDAIVKAIGASHPDDYVVATGEAHSVREFLEAAADHAGVHDWEARVKVDADLRRPVDASVQVGDAHRARQRLGWSPTMGFRDIAAVMVEHDLALGRQAEGQAR